VKLSYYIYYRVPAENAKRARAAVSAMQRDLCEVTGVSGRLLRRRDDQATWMEIYENIADTARFEAELSEQVERHGLSAVLAPGASRKLEIFRSF